MHPFPFARKTILLALTAFILPVAVFAADIPQKTFVAPYNLKVSVKQIGPVTQATDLQIITLLKHSDEDKYIEAMQDFNDKQGGLLATLRERGEFVGESGETFLYTPPAKSVTPTRILLIGLGDERDLSMDRLRVAGRIAAREAVRLKARHVSFAPTLRDQGSSAIDVGKGDAAVIEQVVLAYDTEKRLQAQGLAPNFSIAEWVIEAGPKYYNGVVKHVEQTIESTGKQLKERNSQPYTTILPALKRK